MSRESKEGVRANKLKLSSDKTEGFWVQGRRKAPLTTGSNSRDWHVTVQGLPGNQRKMQSKLSCYILQKAKSKAVHESGNKTDPTASKATSKTIDRLIPQWLQFPSRCCWFQHYALPSKLSQFLSSYEVFGPRSCSELLNPSSIFLAEKKMWTAKCGVEPNSCLTHKGLSAAGLLWETVADGSILGPPGLRSLLAQGTVSVLVQSLFDKALRPQPHRKGLPRWGLGMACPPSNEDSSFHTAPGWSMTPGDVGQWKSCSGTVESTCPKGGCTPPKRSSFTPWWSYWILVYSAI